MITNLVLGSEGFVGKPLCRYLENLGEKVIRFDIKRGVEEDGRTATLKLDDVDRVYFLAWDVGGAKYLYREETQLHQLDWNMRLLLNLMPQLRAKEKAFLFVSSQLAEEYDTVYGVTKRLGEVWAHLLKGVRVRLWNVYGSIEEQSERSHVISDFLWQAINTGEIRMLTTGSERRQFIHIDDVCTAIHYAVSAGLQDVFDITSFEWVRVMDVAKIIAEFTNAKVIPGDLIGNTPMTPIRGKIPNWLPKVSLREGLYRTVNDLGKSLQGTSHLRK
jgi:nucleoside-diphosphate-sugar epimerase